LLVAGLRLRCRFRRLLPFKFREPPLIVLGIHLCAVGQTDDVAAVVGVIEAVIVVDGIRQPDLEHGLTSPVTFYRIGSFARGLKAPMQRAQRTPSQSLPGSDPGNWSRTLQTRTTMMGHAAMSDWCDMARG
jgi:hypothetical protein